MLTTTLGRFGPAARKRLSHLSRPLAALGLLLATAGAAQAQTISFAYTGGTQTYTVPAGVTRLQVVATGASGGSVYGTPARGAQVTATLSVTPGEALTIVVGGQGGVNPDPYGPNAGGYNGGGSVPNGGSGAGGGGGGATDLRRSGTSTGDYLTARNALVVAGGAGGGYGGSGVGGVGGTPAGGNGMGNTPGYSNPGQGATQQGAGAGGGGGRAGSNSQGGAGSSFLGGGGGGGYYGGGGGDGGGAGGGGSSFVTTVGSSNSSYSLASAAGDGSLTITPLVAPTLTSLSPTSGPVGTSVTLTGQDLGSATAVSFNGTGASFTANTDGTLTATVPSGASSGPVTVTTPGGVSNGVAFTVVTAAPVVTAPTTNSTTNGSPIASFTAPANSSVTVSLTGLPDATYITPAGGAFRIGYSNLASGTYTLSATAQSSGQAVSARSNVVTFTVDATPPTATISTTSGSPTSTSPIPFAVSFSEPVTGLSAGSFTVSNGTVTSGPTSSGTNAYTFGVTPTGNGTVTVSLAANAVRDAVGNGNTAANSVSVQYTAPVVSGLSVQYQTGDLGQPTDNQIRPFLQLVNTGATAVPYSSLTVRYWLTVENFMGQLVTPIDYAKLGTSFVSARYVALATPRQGALGYIEYSFAAAAGSLAAGTNSGPIYGKAYKPDYTNFDETDDWSYQTSGSFTTNDHLTLYQNGTLLAGTEPPVVTSNTALNIYSASRDASASTQAVSVQLQVRNTGNTPVNYADVKLRYYFTRDGATAIVPQLDYAKLGNGNITLRVVNLPTAVSGADAYLEVGFAAALGVFYPRTSTDDILFKLRKDNYQALDQTNDYSFTGSTALLVNNRFPAYLNGNLVFGTPPAGAPARVATTSGASGATIVAASGPQALTASPNPFGEQLTLRFALPTTQAYALALYDGQGRLVQQLASGEAVAEQTQELAVSTQGYAAGLYLVRLTTANGVQTLKLVKQ